MYIYDSMIWMGNFDSNMAGWLQSLLDAKLSQTTSSCIMC